MLNYKSLSQIEKYKLGFATLFKNTIISRFDGTGTITRYKQVPIMFSQNGKWYDIANNLRAINNIVQSDVETSFPVPFMSIGIGDITYNEEVGINPMNQVDEQTYVPTPFILPLELNIVTRRASDTLAIVEQIVPLFRPDSDEVTLNLTDDIKNKSLVSMENIDLGIPDEYELNQNHLIYSTINFSMEINLYRLLITAPTTYDIEMGVIAKNQSGSLTEQLLASI